MEYSLLWNFFLWAFLNLYSMLKILFVATSYNHNNIYLLLYWISVHVQLFWFVLDWEWETREVIDYREKNLKITNSFFNVPERRLYTSADNPRNMVNNQRKCINNRSRNSVKVSKTFLEADISWDHNPVVTNLWIKMRKIAKRQNNYIDTTLLKKSNIYKTVKDDVYAAIKIQYR